MDWNDLRYVLALARDGSLAAAARCLAVDATTVARRLRAAEAALGVRLFYRMPDGALRPTRSGEAAAAHAERAEAAVIDLLDAVAGSDATPVGTVRVTSVPILVARVLVPAAAALTARHPGLRLELVAEPRDLSLTRREADVAVRLARPVPRSGRAVLAKRIGRLAYAAYAPASWPAGKEAGLPWVGYEDGMAHLPQARWLATAAAREGGAAPVALNDAEAVLRAVSAGLGRSLLPRAVGDGEAGLRRLAPPPGLPPLPAREVWLLVHPDLRQLARVPAVVGSLEGVVSALDTGG
jgi:DNA-binding transcriptional LysR family regulator